jgi:hypothetical protein
MAKYKGVIITSSKCSLWSSVMVYMNTLLAW